MISQWVLNSITLDACPCIMKDLSKFNIDENNYYGTLLIHIVLSIINLMTHPGIRKVKINIGVI